MLYIQRVRKTTRIKNNDFNPRPSFSILDTIVCVAAIVKNAAARVSANNNPSRTTILVGRCFREFLFPVHITFCSRTSRKSRSSQLYYCSWRNNSCTNKHNKNSYTAFSYKSIAFPFIPRENGPLCVDYALFPQSARYATRREITFRPDELCANCMRNIRYAIRLYGITVVEKTKKRRKFD